MDEPMTKTTTLTAALALSLLAVGACGDDEANDAGADAGVTDTGSTSDTGGDGEAVTIQFAVQLDGADFACGTDVASIGEPTTTLSPIDMRFFVHGIELIAADGTAAPLTLDDDGQWQRDGIALLDFEDATGACENGSTGTNHDVTGTVPAGEYTGIRFVVGVPFDMNHADPNIAEPPLSGTAMHWNWQGGYKFIRFEADTGGDAGYRLHLGSTGCEGTIGNISACSQPNRPVIELDNFDPETNVVVYDLDAMLAGLDLTFNTPDSAPGCMGAADDPECIAPFERLGLDIATGEPGEEQSVFTVR